jgi:hypothetical protein
MPRSLNVQIPDEGFPAIKRLVAFGPGQIQRLTVALRETGPNLDPPGIRALSVCQRMENVDIIEDVETILRDVVFPLRRTIYRYGLSVDEVILGLSDSIATESALGEEPRALDQVDVERWNECKAAVSELFNSVTMKLEGKGESLLDARENRVFSVNIYSDLRPLFDDDATNVNAHVLTNTVVIRFRGDSMAATRAEAFALDPASLIDLKAQVDRAIKKNETLAKGSDAQNIRVLVVRSEEDESGDHQ